MKNGHSTVLAVRLKIAILLASAIDARAKLNTIVANPHIDDAQSFFDLSNKDFDAKAALAQALDQLPTSDFGLRATAGTLLRTLTASAKAADCWQLTRFGNDATACGDTQYEVRHAAIKEFVSEVDLKSLRIMQFADFELTDAQLVAHRIESDAAEMAMHLHSESTEKDFEPADALVALYHWSKDGHYAAEALRIALVAALRKRNNFRRKGGVLKSLSLPIVSIETLAEPASAKNFAAAMVPPVVPAMFDVMNQSLEQTRNKITDVKCGPIKVDHETIYFKLEGRQYRGALLGRNRDFCIGVRTEADQSIALRVYLDGHAVPSAGLTPRHADEYLDGDRYENALRNTYLGVDGITTEGSISSRTHPQTAPIPPIGTWRRSSHAGPDGHEIKELVEWPIGDIEISEDTGMSKRADVARYASWLLAGLEPPPINAVQHVKGHLVVSDHRRLLAAKCIGRKTIKVWVSWTVLSDRADYKDGPCGLTQELAEKGRIPVPLSPARGHCKIFKSDAEMIEKIKLELFSDKRQAA